MGSAKECDAKRYLRRVKKLDDLINDALEERQEELDKATRITPSYSFDGSSRSSLPSDKIGNAGARMADLARKIDRRTDAYVDIKQEADTLLDRMSDEDNARLLRLRYFRYLNFEEIAKKMRCSVRTVIYRHGRALQEYEKIMKEVGIVNATNQRHGHDTAEGGE